MRREDEKRVSERGREESKGRERGGSGRFFVVLGDLKGSGGRFGRGLGSIGARFGVPWVV